MAVVSHYPDVAGLVIQLHALVTVREKEEKSCIQRNTDFQVAFCTVALFS